MEIIDTIKQIMELSRKFKDQEFQQGIVELREQVLALREENLALREDLQNLQKQREIEPSLIRDGNLYYQKTDEKRENPYCMACWGYDSKIVPVIIYSDLYDGHKCFKCVICEARRKNKDR